MHYPSEEEHLATLAALTHDQRLAVRWAFKKWVQTGIKEGYMPMAGGQYYPTNWANFGVEVDHSALLARLLSGKAPLSQKPCLIHAYPNYPD